MVNFGLNSASILGIFLAVAGAGLYFLRSIRPELSRDHDIFFAAVGLLCGLILLFQGWRLDPILQFGQFLLTGSTIFFAVETVRLRGATAEQAKRNSPIVERDRQVSRKPVYTDAALDLQLEPYEDEDYYENNPRLKGSEDARGSRNSRYESEEPRPRSRRSSERYEEDYKSTPRKRRPRPTAESPSRQYDAWEDSQENFEERPSASRPRRPRPDSNVAQTSSAPTRKRRPRPSDTIGGTPYNDDDTDSIPTDYVDYQPIDESPKDNSDWEQDPSRRDYPSGGGRSDYSSSGSDKDDYPSGSSRSDRDNPIQFDY
jgi:Ycf66 protein N-terminus